MIGNVLHINQNKIRKDFVILNKIDNSANAGLYNKTRFDAIQHVGTQYNTLD